MMNIEQSIHEKSLIVRQPKSILGIGLLITLIGGGVFILMAFFQNEPTELWGLFLLVLFPIQGLWYLLITFTWKVTVERDSIRFRNQLGRTKIIPFETIEKVKLKKDPKNADRTIQAVLYSKDGKRIFSVTPSYVRAAEFLNYLGKGVIKFE